MEKPKKFWMIFVSEGKNPTHAHTSYVLAIQEAERLCKKTNMTTFVLESISYFHPPEQPSPIFNEEFIKNDDN